MGTFCQITLTSCSICVAFAGRRRRPIAVER